MKLVNTNRFPLPGTNERFVHIATVTDSMREFVCMFDSHEKKLYVEEVTGGSLEYIDDDSLAQELADFLFHHKVTDLTQGDMVADVK